MANYEELAKNFAAFYHDKFQTDRASLAAVYRPESMLSWEGDQFAGVEKIINKLTTLPDNVRFQLLTLDALPSLNNGVVIFVVGDVSIDDGPPMKFSHVFHLQPSTNGYFVYNDIFRLNIG